MSRHLPIVCALVSLAVIVPPSWAQDQAPIDGTDVIERLDGVTIEPTPRDGSEQPAVPTARPETTTDADAGPNSSNAPAAEAVETGGKPESEPRTSASGCLARLREIADAVRADAPTADDKACTVDDPVRLTSITVDGGAVALSGDPVMHCAFAEKLARWTRDIAVPIAVGQLEQRLVRIGTGNGFQCRKRRGGASVRYSEHAYGNAIDIVSFEFEGNERFDVRPYEEMDAEEAGYLDAVRKAACGYFTTILGPGSNAAHDDHLHFDRGRLLGKDGKPRDNPYRICE